MGQGAWAVERCLDLMIAALSIRRHVKGLCGDAAIAVRKVAVNLEPCHDPDSTSDQERRQEPLGQDETVEGVLRVSVGAPEGVLVLNDQCAVEADL